LDSLTEGLVPPVVASVEMGYGHLRAAHALASALGVEILHVDRPPLAGRSKTARGLKQRDPLHAAYWLREWLNEGTLAAAAWYGFLRMPKFGLYQVLERVGGGANQVIDWKKPSAIQKRNHA
jgi:hypothetical protein